MAIAASRASERTASLSPARMLCRLFLVRQPDHATVGRLQPRQRAARSLCKQPYIEADIACVCRACVAKPAPPKKMTCLALNRASGACTFMHIVILVFA